MRPKIILTWFGMLCSIVIAQAQTTQQIKALQYYYDTDPGVGVVGNGGIISFAAVTNITNQTFTLNTPAIADGLHWLFIRGQNEYNVWGLAERRLVFIQSASQQITAIQYYFDNDPGIGTPNGNGGIINITAAPSINNQLVALPVLGVTSEGFHTLFIRARDEYGKWGIASRKYVFIQSESQNVTALEYYFDTDPGVGNATALAVTTGPNVTTVLNIPAPCLTAGTHQFYLRAKDEFGKWSIVGRSIVTINSGTAPSVIAANGATTFCSGDNVVLSTANSPGVTYQWKESGINISGATTASYTATTSGNYTVVATCNSVSATSNAITVTVNTPPVITTCASSPPVPNDAGSCGAIVNYTAASVTGFPAPSITYSQNAGTFFPEGTTPVTVTASNVCGAPTCSFNVQVNVNHATPATSITTDDDNNEICTGSSITLTQNGGAEGTAGAVFKWYKGGCGSGAVIGTGPSITVTPLTGGVHQYFVRAEGACDNTTCASVSVTVKTSGPSANVAVPSMIGLPVHACSGQVNTLSVPPVGNASQYIWDGPTGTTFNGSGSPYTSSAPTSNITFGNPNGSGYYIGVQAVNACGTSARKSQWVRSTTSVPKEIIGNTTACENTGPLTYSIAPTIGATSYLWTVTGDATINGSGTSVTTTSLSVALNFGPAWVGGTLCVASQTPCFTSIAKCITISRAASVITQINGTFTACPGQTLNYFVAPVNGAATYTWTLPPGCSGSSATNSINVTFNTAFTGGNIKVHVTSICGVVSSDVSTTIYSGVPPIPASITGPLTGLCGQTIVYTCPAQSGVTFTWAVPVGSTINSGQGTNAASVTFGTFGTSTVSVTAGNTCGTSDPRSITVKGAPNSPGAITAIPSSWCANTAGVEFNVDVTNLTGSYTLSWLYPGASVAQYVLGGGNSTSLILNWLTGSGAVNVTASNACGNATRTSTQANSCREGEDDFLTAESFMHVYPNPTRDVLQIELASSVSDVRVIKLLDATGKAVLDKVMNTIVGTNLTSLDVSKVAKGIYMLQVNGSLVNHQARIIIQ